MLDRKVVIYVPSKIGSIENLDKQRKWKRLTLEVFSELFGGATSLNAEGAYKSNDGSLVVENIIIVYAFTDADGEARHRSAVMNHAREIGREMMQECVSVEIGGGMEFVAEAA